MPRPPWIRNKSFREAHRAAELVGSVDSKRALAEEYLARGAYADAVEIYRATAVGQFKDDPALLMGLARAQFLNNDPAGAQASLDALQAADPSFVSGDAHLLYARALEAQGKTDEAIAEYRRLVPYFSGEEARARFAMLLDKIGRPRRSARDLPGNRQAARRCTDTLPAGTEGMGRHRAARTEIATLRPSPVRILPAS